MPGVPLYLISDASNIAIGAVLEQDIHGARQPLGFFSRKLHKPERRYSTFDRELLAVHEATRHFRHLLEGTPYTICTDHKPLVTALTKPGDAWNDRQQRHLSAIAETACTIQYIPGKDNPVADALSRIEIAPVIMGIDYQALAEEQKRDPEIAAYKFDTSSLKMKLIPIGDIKVLCDTSTGRPRPFVPKSFRRQVFETIHSLSHPSIRSTTKLLTNKFVWPSIRNDTRTWARCCDQCQRSKVFRHTRSAIGHLPQPTRRFAHIHVDIVGPLPPSDGRHYLFTIVDRSTRWPEAIPMEDATTTSCSSALLNGWIARFGLPDHITSDRGSVFTSELWSSLAQLLVTSYHPQANGMVERSHRTLKAAITARCSGQDWMSHLPWILLGLRTTPKEGLAVSPAEMASEKHWSCPANFFQVHRTLINTTSAASDK